MNRENSDVRARRWMPSSRLLIRTVTNWSSQCLVSQDLFDVDSKNFAVSLLNLGRHWSGWTSRHDWQFFRATRVNSWGRDRESALSRMWFGDSGLRACGFALQSWLLFWDVTMWSSQRQIGSILRMKAIHVPYVCGFQL